MNNKKLYKSRTDKKIAGVCGGLAAYLGMDSTIVRLIVVFLMLFAGTGLLAYIIAALVIPEEPENMGGFQGGYDNGYQDGYQGGYQNNYQDGYHGGYQNNDQNN